MWSRCRERKGRTNIIRLRVPSLQESVNKQPGVQFSVSFTSLGRVCSADYDRTILSPPTPVHAWRAWYNRYCIFLCERLCRALLSSPSLSLCPRFFRTVMAYSLTTDVTQDCEVEHIPVFSTPSLTYSGILVGTDVHDNARVVRENMVSEI